MELERIRRYAERGIRRGCCDSCTDVPALCDEITRLTDALAASEHERAEAVGLLRKYVTDRCPRYGHGSKIGPGDTTRTIECCDDQCRNSDHVRYVECGHPWHAAAAFLAALDTPPPTCNADNSDIDRDAWFCTRPAGHEGPHREGLNEWGMG